MATAKASAATKTTAKKTTSTAKKTTAKKTTSTAKKTTAKKPSTAKKTTSTGSRIQVTATEKKLVELYRNADSNTKKAAIALLKGEKTQTGNILSSILEDSGLFNNLSDVITGLKKKLKKLETKVSSFLVIIIYYCFSLHLKPDALNISASFIYPASFPGSASRSIRPFL